MICKETKHSVLVIKWIKDKDTKNRDSKKKFCVWASLIVIRAMIKCNVPLNA